MKKENLTHYKQHRRSTHLAGVDIEVMQYEGHNLIFEIESAYFNSEEMVNGRKTGAYIIRFVGVQKPWVVNSVNRHTITKLARASGLSWDDSRWIENWVGLKIQLFFNPDITFDKEQTGGIRVRPVLPVERKKPVFDESNFEKALEQNATIELIKKHYTISVEVENAYLELLNNK